MTPLVLLAAAVPAGAPVPADRLAWEKERAALRGVWQTPAGAKTEFTFLFHDRAGGWAGYAAREPGARPLDTASALEAGPATAGAADGKRFLDVRESSGDPRRVGYRFEGAELVVGADGAEHRLRRVNTRASETPAAKNLLGTWAVEWVESQGVGLRGKDAFLETVVFTEDRCVLGGPERSERLNAFYRLGAAGAKGPAELDWYWVDDPSHLIPAAYEVDGDELRIAYLPWEKAVLTGKRPAGFDTERTQTVVIRAKRAK